MLLSHFLPRTDTGVFHNDFYGIFLASYSDSARIIWRTGVVFHSLLRRWTLTVITRLGRVRERKVAVAPTSRSISQDRLLYCYWCCYLVRHNWILKYNITHSSCWEFDISISLLMHIQVDVVKCKCMGGTCGWMSVVGIFVVIVVKRKQRSKSTGEIWVKCDQRPCLHM